MPNPTPTLEQRIDALRRKLESSCLLQPMNVVIINDGPETKFEDVVRSLFADVFAERDQLKAIVDRLPKTADNVPITLGMKCFAIDQDSPWEIFIGNVESISGGIYIWDEHKGTATILLDGSDIEVGNLDCYSTHEAAESAMKGDF